MLLNVGKAKVRLVPPKSQALRWETLSIRGLNRMRCVSAMIGHMWPHDAEPLKATYMACQCSPVVYGGAVMEELIERGLVAADLLTRADEVEELFCRGLILVSGDDVEAAEGNSEAPSGA